MSRHCVSPVPVKPDGQGPQMRPPTVLVQLARKWQPPLLVAHSFTSTQFGGWPLKPSGQFEHTWVGEPAGNGTRSQQKVVVQPPLLVSHSLMFWHTERSPLMSMVPAGHAPQVRPP